MAENLLYYSFTLNIESVPGVLVAKRIHKPHLFLPIHIKKNGVFLCKRDSLLYTFLCGQADNSKIVNINARKEDFMEKIASFTIDHIKLQPGIYVSRKDTVGQEVITTFDLRMTSPNEEPVMNTAEIHTIEHLAATFLRNHPVYKDKTIYFGPMGCRTGFYLLLAGDLTSKDIVPLMIEMYEFIRDFKDEVPGASPRDCGNYLDMNLNMANYLANKFLDQVLYHITEDRLVYPQ